jgi:hypothetical protein
MPSWLIEGHPAVYALLAAVLAALLVIWWRTRKRNLLIAAAAVAALILGYFLLDRFVESDSERMIRKVNEIAAAVSANDLNVAFQNVSERFDRAGVDKSQFRDFCQRMKNGGNVGTVKVWDLEAGDISRPAGTGTVAFRFKVTGNWGESPPNYMARAFFVLDGDGKWRLKSFEIYDALNQSTTPVAIPGWGTRR